MQTLTDSLFQEAKTVEASNRSACYFPLNNGRYEVKPGFIPFGFCFGNGEADKQVFQIDDNFTHYRQVKLLARAERLSKYYQTCYYSDTVTGKLTRSDLPSGIAHLIIHRLTQEHPQHFYSERLPSGEVVFYSQLTGETLYLNANWELQQIETQGEPVIPLYASTLDALAAQVQEDIAVIRRWADGSNALSAVHLCYPNHWSAEEKIGKDFVTVHSPVAGIDKINRRASAIINTMIVQEPMVRFSWGLSTDTRLNHHPEPPPNVPINQWQGRQFNQENPRLFLRIERQVIWGLPEHDAALFTIRTYFRDCCEVKKDTDLRQKLFSSIQSMTQESLIYKGLVENRDSILAWLEEV
jgi:dimethylamine monooxygenase subunit A